jgi:hypothetical protein
MGPSRTSQKTHVVGTDVVLVTVKAVVGAPRLRRDSVPPLLSP